MVGVGGCGYARVFFVLFLVFFIVFCSVGVKGLGRALVRIRCPHSADWGWELMCGLENRSLRCAMDLGPRPGYSGAWLGGWQGQSRESTLLRGVVVTVKVNHAN